MAVMIDIIILTAIISKEPPAVPGNVTSPSLRASLFPLDNHLGDHSTVLPG